MHYLKKKIVGGGLQLPLTMWLKMTLKHHNNNRNCICTFHKTTLSMLMIPNVIKYQEKNIGLPRFPTAQKSIWVRLTYSWSISPKQITVQVTCIRSVFSLHSTKGFVSLTQCSAENVRIPKGQTKECSSTASLPSATTLWKTTLP